MKRTWQKQNDLTTDDFDNSWDTQYDGRTPLSNVHRINLDRIVADEQTRTHFDAAALQHLADNMKEHGQLQPARVRWDASRDKYQLIAGERRFRAALLAHLPTLDCIVTEADDQKALVENVLENAQRQDLQPLEQARAFQQLMDVQHWSGAQLARNIQLDRSTVTRALKLLTLPEDIQAKIEGGELTPTQALRRATPAQSPTPKRRRITREEKIPTKRGAVTVKGRRLMTDDVLIDALTEALTIVQQRQQFDASQSKAA